MQEFLQKIRGLFQTAEKYWGLPVDRIEIGQFLCFSAPIGGKDDGDAGAGLLLQPGRRRFVPDDNVYGTGEYAFWDASSIDDCR